MALNWVQVLFNRNKWFYKTGFSYLFNNPLWNGPVPKNGFSLCPYFWTTLFSLTLFRAFVYLALGIRWIVNSLKLGKLIKWSDAKFFRMLELNDDDSTLGILTFLGIGLLTAIIGCTILLLELTLLSIIEYSTVGMSSLIYLSTLLPIALGLSYLSHKRNWIKFTRNEYRCLFGFIAGVIFAIGLNMNSAAAAEFYGEIFSLLQDAIVYVSILVYDVIIIAAKWIFSLIIDLFSSLISGWAYILVTIGFSAVVSYCLSKTDVLYNISLYYKLRSVREEAYKYISSEIKNYLLSSLDYYYYSSHFLSKKIAQSYAVSKYIFDTIDSEAWLNVNDFSISIPHERIKELANAVVLEIKAEEASIYTIKEQYKKSKIFNFFDTFSTYLKAFISIIWQLIKALKNKACPYINFTD